MQLNLLQCISIRSGPEARNDARFAANYCLRQYGNCLNDISFHAAQTEAIHQRLQQI